MRQRMILLCGLIWLLLPLSLAAAEGMAYREYPLSASIMLDSEGRLSSEQALQLREGDFFRVELRTAGGTGYQWELKNDAPELAQVVYRATEPLDANAPIPLAGGKTRTIFIFRVASASVLSETLRFSLERSWETHVKPLQELTLTVTKL